MNSKEYREAGKTVIDFIADYQVNIRNRPVLPKVRPGFLIDLLPKSCPKKGERWQDILEDTAKEILPAMTHWQSPRFHAYYPAGGSFASAFGDMLATGFGSLSFNWISSPASTELEMVVMNWLGELLYLPKQFLFSETGKGGGIIQNTACESIFVALLAAQKRVIRSILEANPEKSKDDIRAKLVGYSSDQSNVCVEKAGQLGSMSIKLLDSSEKGQLTAETLRKAVLDDLKNGFIPCFVVANFGTTGTCSIDDLTEIGPVCQEFDLFLHVDAAYAGAALILPEYRHFAEGLKYAHSFNFNPHKWLLVHFHCSTMWITDSSLLEDALKIDRIYLNYHMQGQNSIVPDYKDWQVSLGKPFRAMKVWTTLRLYGADGLQAFLRKQIKLADMFAEKVMEDDRFELVLPASMGLVCFRLRGENIITDMLYDRLMKRGKIFMIVATIQNKLFIRFCVCSYLTDVDDIEYAWNEISTQGVYVLNELNRLDNDTKPKLAIQPRKYSSECDNGLFECNLTKVPSSYRLNMLE